MDTTNNSSNSNLKGPDETSSSNPLSNNFTSGLDTSSSNSSSSAGMPSSTHSSLGASTPSSGNFNNDINPKPLPSYVGMPSSNFVPQQKAPIVIDEALLAKKTAEYNKSRAVSSPGNHIYLWSIISFIILLIIGGATYWYFFMNGTNTELNDSTDANASDNSAFPVGAINKNTTNPTTPTNNSATVTPSKIKTVTPALNGSQRDLISAYIRKNINSLSPRKSSRAYTVTDITFDGPDRALVSYTNGTASYTAVATASVSANGGVKILSFTLLDK